MFTLNSSVETVPPQRPGLDVLLMPVDARVGLGWLDGGYSGFRWADMDTAYGSVRMRWQWERKEERGVILVTGKRTGCCRGNASPQQSALAAPPSPWRMPNGELRMANAGAAMGKLPIAKSLGQAQKPIHTFDGDAVLPPGQLRRRIAGAGVADDGCLHARSQFFRFNAYFDRLRGNCKRDHMHTHQWFIRMDSGAGKLPVYRFLKRNPCTYFGNTKELF